MNKKSVFTIVTLLAGAVTAYSQGQVYFSDYLSGNTTGFNIHIWSPNPLVPGDEQTGNSSVAFSFGDLNGDAPTGHMNSYGGQLIGGSGSSATSSTLNYTLGNDFDTELYAAAGTVSTFSTSTFSAIPATLNPIATANGSGGLMSTPGVTVTFGGTSGTPGAPTVAQGEPVTLAIAAWFNGGGTITSLTAAQVINSTPWGVSPVGTENVTGAPYTPDNLPGLGDSYTTAGGITSFSLGGPQTPEPPTVALVLWGASAFLLRIRRKQ